MTFTRRRTVLGLVIAVVLGLLSAGVFVVDDRIRARIVDHGTRTRAVVTVDHDGEIDHWYTVTYTAQGGEHQADLRHPWLMDRWPLGLVLTVYVDPADPDRIVTEDGYATPVWTSAPGWLAVLAVFAAFIAIAGRLLGVRSERRRRAGPAATRP